MSRVRVAAAGSVQLLRSQPVSRCLHTVVARGALLLLTTFASVCVLCLDCRKHRVVVTVFGEIGVIFCVCVAVTYKQDRWHHRALYFLLVVFTALDKFEAACVPYAHADVAFPSCTSHLSW
jgi:hypothetical protein